MQLRFDDATVVVTGASSGIGAAVARAFGTAGAHVVVHYGSDADGAAATLAAVEAAAGTGQAIQADVRDPDQLEQLLEETATARGKIDVLVNNAGGLVARRPLQDADPSYVDEVLTLNLASVATASRIAAPHLPAGGAIVNISSMAARMGGGTGTALYSASKGGVEALTRALAKELAPAQVRVNAVAPGIIRTPFHTRHTDESVLERQRELIPLGRLGEPEDCAGPVLFLAHPQASGYVTGHVLAVNGGYVFT
jgi:3-oxoacyl-[acyl-carrier protein] reductase